MTHDNHEGTKLHGMGVASWSRLDTHDRGTWGSFGCFSWEGLIVVILLGGYQDWMRRSLRIDSSIRTAYGQADSLLGRSK